MPIFSGQSSNGVNFFHTLHPKTQFFLSVFFAVFLIAALMWFVFFFLFDRIRIESSEIEAAKIRRASLEARRGEARREEIMLAESRTDIGRIEETFADRPLAFFEFLENLALRDNLAVSLALEGQVADEKPERLRVTVSGVYGNLLRFIRGIESSPYVTEIRGITLQMIDQRSVFSNSLARFIIDLQIISK